MEVLTFSNVSKQEWLYCKCSHGSMEMSSCWWGIPGEIDPIVELKLPLSCGYSGKEGKTHCEVCINVRSMVSDSPDRMATLI